MKLQNLTSFLLLIHLTATLFSSDAYFSPDGGIRDQIIKRINLSKSTIDVCVYSFTSGEIAQALTDAHRRGVKIRVIRDKVQSTNKDDENSFLIKNGIEVHVIKGKGRGMMHNKFAVFDGKEAITGSYNWSENAEQFNYENALFTDDVDVINEFSMEFEDLWEAP